MTADPEIGQHFGQMDEVKFSMNLSYLCFYHPFLYSLGDLESKTYLLTNQTGDHRPYGAPIHYLCQENWKRHTLYPM